MLALTRVFILAALTGGLLFASTTLRLEGAQQPAPPATGNGLILGQVVDGTGLRPVGAALVTLRGSGAGSQPDSVIADENGKFVFFRLPSGAYTLTATSSGYTDGSFGQLRPSGPSRTIDLAVDQRVANATIRIWRLASISGAISDEHGEPIVGVTVRLLRRTLTGGRRRMLNAGSMATDDRGFYRFSTLTPADYVVTVPATTSSVPTSTVDLYSKATRDQNSKLTEALLREVSASGAPSPATPGYRVGDAQVLYATALTRLAPQPADRGRMMVFQTTFYPNTSVAAEAQVITLAPGEERRATDLQMRLVTAARVSGVVTGPEGPVPNVGVKLVPVDVVDWSSGSGYETATSATDANGRFSLPAAPSGRYVLRVQRRGSPTLPTLWAEVPVAVSGADVANIDVVARTGVSVSGRVEFEGTTPQPAPDRVQRTNVTLTQSDGLGGATNSYQVGGNGRFVTVGYAPGKYTITAGTPGAPWVLKSVQVAGRDISSAPLVVDLNDVSDVVLTFTDKQTQLSGTVQGVQAPDLEALIVVFPATVQSWIDAGMPARVSRIVRPAKTGAFSSAGLPPGEYCIAAIPDARSTDWQEAATLSKLAALASRISLADGEKKTVDLRVQQIR